MKRSLLAIAVCLLASAVQAENDVVTGCVDVYRVSTANLSENQRVSAKAASLREKMCDGSTAKKDFTFDTGVDILFEGIPLGGEGDGQLTIEDANLFCSSYDSITKSFEAEQSFSREIVTAALGNFNACMDLASRQVSIKAAVTSASNATIRITKTDGDPITLTSFSSSPDLICKSPQMGENKLEFGKQYKSDGNFSIDCQRVGKVEEGKFVFEPGFLSLTVSRSDYPFQLIFAKDAILSPQLSSQAQQAIGALEAERARLEASLAETQATAAGLQTRLDGVSAYAIMVYRGGSSPLGNSEGYHHMGCAVDWDHAKSDAANAGADPWTKTPCKKDFELVKLQPFHISSGPPCGHTWRQFICLKK